MQPDHRARYTFGFALLAALLAALILWNLNTGSLHLSPAEVMDILLTRTGENAAIVWEMRLPRLIAAMLLGGALSISGFLLQTFFANPIAGPFVLGISSGAKLTVSLAMIGLLSRGRVIGSTGMILAAFCGAMLSMGFVLALAQRVRRCPCSSSRCDGRLHLLGGHGFRRDLRRGQQHRQPAQLVTGSFSGISWDKYLRDGAGRADLARARRAAVQADERLSARRGLRAQHGRSISAPSAPRSFCSRACSPPAWLRFAGPISFVGIAVPQLMKGLFGTAKPLVQVPACFAGGAVFCLFCDLAARTVFAPTELSISSVTAILGAHRNLHHGAPPHTHAVKGENAMADQLLRAENMTVGYGGVPLIRDIALSRVGRRNFNPCRAERLASPLSSKV